MKAIIISIGVTMVITMICGGIIYGLLIVLPPAKILLTLLFFSSLVGSFIGIIYVNTRRRGIKRMEEETGVIYEQIPKSDKIATYTATLIPAICIGGLAGFTVSLIIHFFFTDIKNIIVFDIYAFPIGAISALISYFIYFKKKINFILFCVLFIGLAIILVFTSLYFLNRYEKTPRSSTKIQNTLKLKHTNLRSSYKTLSKNEVKTMLKKYKFFCKKDIWSESYCNPSGDFINDFKLKTINGDKVVIDNATGLMWHWSGSEGIWFFFHIKEWIMDFNRRGYAGYHDWRLPTLEEAASLLECSPRRNIDYDLYIDPIFSTRQEGIWTGDKVAGTDFLWVVNFFNGIIASHDTFSFTYICPVRSIN